MIAQRHACPICGDAHYPAPDPAAECVCGHLAFNHDNQGGRRKRAPCSLWIDLDTNPIPCPCEDFTQ